MKRMLALCAAFLLASPAIAAPDSPAVATSRQPHSNVSLLVEPQLNDGRLVLKVAAQNSTGASVPFGPTSVSISKPSGEAIALSSLQQLTNDVRAAAGMTVEAAPPPAPVAGGYAAPQMQVDSAGHPDVSNFTGGSTVGADEMVRQANRVARKSKPTIDRQTAQAQIAALQQALLQDTTVQPGRVAAGEVVSQKLKFNKGEDRTLHLRVRIAGDEHAFTIAAPKD